MVERVLSADGLAYLTDLDRIFAAKTLTIRDFDLDAFAEGVLAHRNNKGFHENPFRAEGHDLELKRLSWSMGWNERALQIRD